MTDPKPKSKVEEKEVDVMKDAPPERPYGEAITDEHREFLRENGTVVE